MRAYQTMVFGLIILLAACADGVSWSDREQENGEQILESLAAVSEAARIINASDTDMKLEARRERLLGELRRAHRLAANVDEFVLEKLHPLMFSKFRLTYQRALARMIRAYETGDIDDAERAAADVQDFFEWFRDNRHQFRWWDTALE